MKSFLVALLGILREINIRGRVSNYNSEEAKILAEEGIVVVPNYLSEDECNKIKSEIDSLLSANEANKEIKDGAYINYRDSEDGYENYDTGMLDFKNIDKMVEGLDKIRFDEKIKNIISGASGLEIESKNFNSYINKGIDNTRVYHVDTYFPVQYKSFVYLTDVDSDKDGPYSYIKYSHKNTLGKIKNLFFNFLKGYPLTDTRLYPQEHEAKMIAKKGTLVISNQNGYHRGIPQDKEHSRMILVNNFYTK